MHASGVLIFERTTLDLDDDLVHRASGNPVPNAWFAALAIAHGGESVTADRDLGRSPGLRWRHPLDGGR